MNGLPFLPFFGILILKYILRLNIQEYAMPKHFSTCRDLITDFNRQDIKSCFPLVPSGFGPDFPAGGVFPVPFYFVTGCDRKAGARPGHIML